MINFTCKYAYVFDPKIKPEISETTVYANLSTSRKDKRTNPIKYINSNWSNVAFRGDAFLPAKELKGGEKIDVIKGSITHEKDEKSGKTFLNLVVFEFALSETSSK